MCQPMKGLIEPVKKKIKKPTPAPNTPMGRDKAVIGTLTLFDARDNEHAHTKVP